MAGETLPTGSTNTQGLADFAAPYITGYLGKAQALSDSPYQVYQGPLTAGQSNLQNTAFTGLGSLTVPSSISDAATTAGGFATQAGNLSYTPTTQSFDATQAQNYMNPYLQASLNPPLDEARRQSQITQQQNAAKMTQAGAFGGGRQAIRDASTHAFSPAPNGPSDAKDAEPANGSSYASTTDVSARLYPCRSPRHGWWWTG